MSLIKLAWAGVDAQTAVQGDLANLKGGISNGWQRGRSAVSQHKDHLANVAELKAAKDYHASQVGRVGESDALARLQKAQSKVQGSAAKLRESINPNGKAAVIAGRTTKVTPIPTPSAPVESGSIGSFLGKAKDFAMKNKAAVGIGTAIAAGGYLAHKANQNKRQYQQQY
jgi:hypothetical protein